MRVLGLLVGVDVQQDEEIEQLPFAGADAEWLHALLADMNDRDPESREGDLVLLQGQDATHAGVGTALSDLVTRSRTANADLVMIHFSCHGTPQGRLVMADTIVRDQERSSLLFEEVACAVEQVSGAHVVASFDACFSGRAVSTAPKPGDQTIEARMERTAGINRVLIAAACAHERAWESPRYRHGLLSYGLLQGLDGETLAEGGTVSIQRWINHAADMVAREAAAMGVVQNASQFCRWQGAGTMPAVGPGPRTRALLARGDEHQVGPDIADLAAYGLPASYLEAITTRTNGNPLNEMQVAAINRGGVLAGKNVVVSAPTSSGKTLVGELAVLAAALRRRRAVVLLPSRALVAEKWEEFREAFGGLGLRAVRSYGGVDDDDLAIGTNHFDVAFLTYEKFLLLALTRPRLLDVLATVVLDEVHLLSDLERGRSVEILLALLRLRIHQNRPVQLVALSAALGEMNGLERWLDARLVTEGRRPVPLREGVVSPSGRFRFRDPDSGEEGEARVFDPIPTRRGNERPASVASRVAVALAGRLVEDEGERVLLFRAHKPATRELAEKLANELDLAPCAEPLRAVAGGATGIDTSRATRQLSACLGDGVAFHLADLEQTEREAVEGAFRRGELRFLVATSGLAMGINTPASTVVVVDHTRYSPATGERDYEVTEYRNMSGRAGRWIPAGRPGTSYLVAVDDRDADELFERYVLGQPEALVSRLGELDRADLLLALLAFVPETTEAALMDLAADTFHGFVNGDDAGWRQNFRKDSRDALLRLIANGFVTRVGEDGVRSTELGRICGRENLSMTSALRVLLAAETLAAVGDPLDELSLIGLAQITVELDRTPTPFGDADAQGWPALVPARIRGRDTLLAVLGTEPAMEGPRLKRLFTMVRWVQGARMEEMEDEFCHFREGRQRSEPAAGIIRSIAGRSGHVLRPIGALLAVRYPDRHEEIKARVVDLQPRLEFGIDRESTGLARHRLGIRRGQINQLRAINRATFDSLYDGLRAQEPEVWGVFGTVVATQLLHAMERIRGGARKQGEIDLAARIRLFDALPAVSAV